jgi:hypothetical protein
MRRTGHIPPTGDIRSAHKRSVEKPEEKWPLRDLDADGKIILKWILKKQDTRV